MPMYSGVPGACSASSSHTPGERGDHQRDDAEPNRGPARRRRAHARRVYHRGAGGRPAAIGLPRATGVHRAACSICAKSSITSMTVRAALARRSPAAASSLDAIAALGVRRSAGDQRAARRCARSRTKPTRRWRSSTSRATSSARGATRSRRCRPRVKALDVELREVEAELEQALLAVPNMPARSRAGRQGRATTTSSCAQRGEKPAFDFAPKDHVELGTKLGLLDFERAVKISGARFVVLRGAGARLSAR